MVGFLAGYSGLTRRRIGLICASTCSGPRMGDLVVLCPPRRHRKVRTPPRNARRARSTIAAGCARWRASTGTPNKKGYRDVTAVHVRRPRLDYESHATGLDRNEVGAMLVAAGLGRARDHALIVCWR